MSAKLAQKTARTLIESTDEVAYTALRAYQSATNGAAADETKKLTEIQTQIYPLALAIQMDSAPLFDTHIEQLRRQDTSQARDQELTAQLVALKQVLSQRLPITAYILAAKYLNDAIGYLSESLPSVDIPKVTFPMADNPLGELASRYLEALMAADRQAAIQLIVAEARRSTDVRAIYEHVFVPVQWEVGERWHRRVINIAQEHFCTATTELAAAQLYQFRHALPRNGRMAVVTTVAGDLHGMGARIIADYLEMEGWKIYYLGVNTPTESLLHLLEELQPDLLAMAASMPQHVTVVRELVVAKEQNPQLSKIKVLVGGAAFSTDAELWKTTGADAFAASPAKAVAWTKTVF
ncbi:B12-binding domain-containing protein [Hymenobacter sp. BT730]|uniref:cobalamin B12-binding domain-containing protein n=1 Tax=Hymenobacter sp. BT730 TaxID=3063332 RepID=UPI0026DFF9B2|nr:cobalamin-dependent protein [Hymenobacter sp. BT730]